MLAPFTEAVKDFFERATWGGAPVPAVFAGPDRAFAEMERVMKARSQGKTSVATGATGVTRQQATDKPAWVPFFSVLIQPHNFNPALWNPASYRGITKNLQTGVATSIRLRPIKADIQVDLWCGAAGGWSIAQNVQSQIELQFFAESIYLPIDWSEAKWYREPFNVLEHARALGRTRFRLVNNGWQDTSDLEVGEGLKYIRWTWSGRLEGDLPYRPDEARIVRTISMDITDEGTNEVLATATGGRED